MKKLIFNALLIFCLSLYSQENKKRNDQDTIYLNVNKNEIIDKEFAVYYRIVDTESEKTVRKTYFLSGQIAEETSYSNYKRKIRDGKHLEYNEDGEVLVSIDYKAGVIDGQLLTFWENKIPKRIDYYKKGEFIKGTCFDVNGKKIKHFDFVICPSYKYGKKSLLKFLKNEIKYPESLIYKAEGRVVVSFIVEIDGSVSNLKLESSSFFDAFDEEVFRVIRTIKDFVPGKIDGVDRRMRMSMPVNFLF